MRVRKVIILSIFILIFVCNTKIVSAQSNLGKIVKIKGNLAAINIGKNHGIKIGSKLIIFREMGSLEDNFRVKIGELLILKVVDNNAAGKINLYDDTIFIEVGDIVQIVNEDEFEIGNSAAKQTIPKSNPKTDLKSNRFALFGIAGKGNPLTPSGFTDYWNSGLSFGGGILFETWNQAGITVSITQNMFTLDDDKVLRDAGFASENLNISGGMINILIVSANMLISFSEPDDLFHFHLSAGAGLYNIGYEEVTLSDGLNNFSFIDESDSKFGTNFGIAGELKLNSYFGIIFQGAYHIVYYEGDKKNLTFTTLDVGISISTGI